MASICQAIACPHCGCAATEDEYYKIGEKFIWCFRCGYSYYKTINYEDDNDAVYNELAYEGHGVFYMVSKNGKRKNDGRRILNRPLSEQEIVEFIDELQDEDVDLTNSYFVTYENGSFTTIAGTPPEDFYMPFNDYKAKIGEGNMEVIVPIASLDSDE